MAENPSKERVCFRCGEKHWGYGCPRDFKVPDETLPYLKPAGERAEQIVQPDSAKATSSGPEVGALTSNQNCDCGTLGPRLEDHAPWCLRQPPNVRQPELQRREAERSHLESKAESWRFVWELLKAHNPDFFEEGESGREAVEIEIHRLQSLDKDKSAQSKLTHGGRPMTLRECMEAEESSRDETSEEYPGEVRMLLQMAETANRTGHDLPKDWGSRVRALLSDSSKPIHRSGEPETAETAARQPDGSAASPATRSRRQIDAAVDRLPEEPLAHLDFTRGGDAFHVLRILGNVQISAGKAAELLRAMQAGEKPELMPWSPEETKEHLHWCAIRVGKHCNCRSKNGKAPHGE